MAVDPNDEVVQSFWEVARRKVGWAGIEVFVGQRVNTALLPPAAHLADLASEATELARQVRDGDLTQSVVALEEYEGNQAELPHPGDLTIICDGEGIPLALVQTTGVNIEQDSEGQVVVEEFRSLYPQLTKKRG